MKPQQWASESGIKFHLETPASNNSSLDTFTALCGFSGVFRHQRNENHTFLRCAECERISSANILDVAYHTITTAQGLAQDGVTVGGSGEVSEASPLQSSRPECCPSSALNAEEEVSTGSRKRSECAVHSSVGRPTDFLNLPVPLGREVSGTVEGHGDSVITARRRRDAALTIGYPSENQASPADQILPRSSAQGREGADSSDRESAPEYQGTTIENLFATVERVTLKQRIDFEMRLNRELPRQSDPIHDSNRRW